MRHYIDLVELLLEDFDTNRFMERVRGVMELVRRGGTEGERSAAKHAFDRMIERATTEIKRMREPDSGVTRMQVDRFMQALERINAEFKGAQKEPPKAKKPPPRMPLFKVGQWVAAEAQVGKITEIVWLTHGIAYKVRFDTGEVTLVEDRLRPATQDEVDAALAKRSKTTTSGAMGGFNIISFARYVSAAENSNKVYGVTQKLDTGRIYTFWGGWQKPLKVKHYRTESDAMDQFNLKIRKGYQEVSPGTDTEDWLMRALRTEFSRIGESRS